MASRLFALAKGVIDAYLNFHVSRASAGLSYFLMLTVFPLLVCLYNMLGSMFPGAEALARLLRGLLPPDTVEIIKEFIGYVSVNTDPRLLPVAIAAMLTSSAAGFRIIDSLMRELRGGGRRRGGFVFSFLFSVVFLAAVYLAAVIMIGGGRFISRVDEYILGSDISQSRRRLGFALLFLLLFLMIVGVYRLSLPEGKGGLLVPGALAACLALVALGILFSWFIGMSAKYPLVYGSLASAMIMLLWLYICGNVLFLGNILNIVLERARERRM